MPERIYVDPFTFGAVVETWAEVVATTSIFTDLASKAREKGAILGALPYEVHAMISKALYNLLLADRTGKWEAYRSNEDNFLRYVHGDAPFDSFVAGPGYLIFEQVDFCRCIMVCIHRPSRSSRFIEP